MQKVFVLDSENKPLSPCSNARGRILLKKGKAELFCKDPFTIKLKEENKMTEENKKMEISEEEKKILKECEKRDSILLEDLKKENVKKSELCEKAKNVLEKMENSIKELTVEDLKKDLEKSFAGNILETDWIKGNESFYFEKDADVPALCVSEDGITFKVISIGTPDKFILLANGRSQEEAISSLKQKEDILTTRLLIHACSKYGKYVQIEGVSKNKERMKCFNNRIIENKERMKCFNNRIIEIHDDSFKTDLESLQNLVERNRILVDKFILNHAGLNSFRTTINTIDYECTTSKDMLLSGVLGNIWGVNLFKFYEEPVHKKHVAEGNIILAVAQGRYFGKRIIESYGVLFNHETKFYEAFCTESMVIINPLAIAGGFSGCFLEKKLITNSIKIL